MAALAPDANGAGHRDARRAGQPIPPAISPRGRRGLQRPPDQASRRLGTVLRVRSEPILWHDRTALVATTGDDMTRRLICAGLVSGALAFTAATATGASSRQEMGLYAGAGGAVVGTFDAYASVDHPLVADNIGLVRSTSRRGEKWVRIRVEDGSGTTVAARIEVVVQGRGYVLVTCNASSVAPIRLRAITELRVFPLGGTCLSPGTVAVSSPTTGRVLFDFS